MFVTVVIDSPIVSDSISEIPVSISIEVLSISIESTRIIGESGYTGATRDQLLDRRYPEAPGGGESKPCTIQSCIHLNSKRLRDGVTRSHYHHLN